MSELELLKKIEYELDAFLEEGYYPNAHITLEEVKEMIKKKEPPSMRQT